MDIETADSLAIRADESARLEPGSMHALQAAHDSAAAEEALADSGVPGGRFRLARALWRRAGGRTGDELPAARDDALRCWTVCRSLLDHPDPALDPDAVVAEITYWLGVLVPILRMADQLPEAAEALARVHRAAGEAAGVPAMHATARLNQFVYAAKVDEFAEAKVAGDYARIAHDLDEVIERAAQTLKILEVFASHSPHEASEYAEAVRVASRLVTITGHVALAARMFDQAEAVSASLTRFGPLFLSHADAIRRERDGLSAWVPRR
ncbi:hypothetical protein [Micromonospora sp. LOL_024]|uniref:hypothetical protein n=1 Tax=Micromonospora sp. LOL_024 TaxID=3345412 RepID=UPI003A89671D